MKSVGQKIKQLAGLIGTKDVSDWENRFIKNVDERTDGGEYTTELSGKQLDIISSIHEKHFA